MIQDKIEKLSQLDMSSQLGMIYMWVKQNHIAKNEFILLIEWFYNQNK